MLSFLSDLFTLVIALAAVIGFMVVLCALVEYLDERDSLMSAEHIVGVGRTADDEIAELRDEAIGDMFDQARRARLHRHVAEPESGDQQ